MERGNQPATVPVRPHFFVGAGLLGLAALGLVLQGLLPFVSLADAAVALLAGCTLFAHGIAYWYLPSFAKRAVVAQPLAAYAGPVALPLATLLHLLDLPRARDATLAFALALFAATTLASAALGPRWRSGIPFWREGPRRRDDRAAAATLALSFVAMLGLAWLLVLGMPMRGLLVAWLAALALFALGALAHLLPRVRSRPGWPALVVAGALAGAAGVAWLLFVGSERVGFALALGFPLAALGAAPPGSPKRAGPRLREAGPLLALGAAQLAAALVLANALAPLRQGVAEATLVALLAALTLGVAGLSLLTLPVLFNQRPYAPAIAPTLGLALIGTLLLGAELLYGVAAFGGVVLALALASWLRVLWPLRRPRRECPPEDAEAS